jgi:hypothetical protein
MLDDGKPSTLAKPSNIAPSGNEQNLDFEARFRRERADLVSRLGRERPPLSLSP